MKLLSISCSIELTTQFISEGFLDGAPSSFLRLPPFLLSCESFRGLTSTFRKRYRVAPFSLLLSRCSLVISFRILRWRKRESTEVNERLPPHQTNRHFQLTQPMIDSLLRLHAILELRRIDFHAKMMSSLARSPEKVSMNSIRHRPTKPSPGTA